MAWWPGGLQGGLVAWWPVQWPGGRVACTVAWWPAWWPGGLVNFKDGLHQNMLLCVAYITCTINCISAWTLRVHGAWSATWSQRCVVCCVEPAVRGLLCGASGAWSAAWSQRCILICRYKNSHDVNIGHITQKIVELYNNYTNCKCTFAEFPHLQADCNSMLEQLINYFWSPRRLLFKSRPCVRYAYRI